MNRYFKTLPDGTTVWYEGFIHRDGKYIYTWNEELILADGWVKYIPPTPEPMPQTEPSTESIARQLLALNSVKAEIVALSDEDAIKLVSLFPAWIDQIGKTVKVGERYYYDERLWKVLLEHTVQDNWNPADSPSLFVQVTVEEWPNWRQPVGSTDSYNKGDKVSHLDKHWVSDVDGNVWEPSVYGWTEFTD